MAVPTTRDGANPAVGLRAYAPSLWVAAVLALFALLALSVFGFQTRDPVGATAVALVVGLASLVVGFLAGFIFGIPRALQNAAADGGSGYTVNTNLEQISDWLTKIIVGVGLVQLTELSGAFERLTNFLQAGMGDEPAARVVAGADIIFFLIFGFLIGYLLTRTLFLRLFALSDRSAATYRELEPILAKSAATLADAEAVVLEGSDKEDNRADPDSEEDIEPSQNREPWSLSLDVPETSFSSLQELRSRVIERLAKLFNPRIKVTPPPQVMLTTLERRGTLTSESARSLREFLSLVDATGRQGESLKNEDRARLFTSGQDVLRGLLALERNAGAKFEDFVLQKLLSVVEPDWLVNLDAKPNPESRGRVDAVVQRGERTVAVEVRPRLMASDRQQVAAIQKWLATIPEGLPVLLIVLGDGVTPARIDPDGNRRVSVLNWDRGGSESLSREIKSMLGEQ